MKRLLVLLPLLAAFVALPKAAHAGRDTWEILEQVVPAPGNPNSDKMAVKIDSTSVITAEAQSWLTPATANVSCSTFTATVLFAANANRTSHVVVNEGTNPIRIGPATITSAIGLRVPGGGSATLDGPGIFKGALYCQTVGTSASSVSAIQGNP